MYGVEAVGKTESLIVYTSEVQLRCEMVAIALTLSSLYGEPTTHRVLKNGKECVLHVTPELSFSMMQTKMRRLIYNRKITSAMPFVPDRFTDMAKSMIVRTITSGGSLDTVKNRLYTEVEKYASHVRSQNAKEG